MEVVLVEPEIPQNTGAIARTCAATSTRLHLVGKLGFELSEKSVRRAGLDYWPYVDLECYPDWDSFTENFADRSVWFFSTKAENDYWDVEYSKNDLLVFGSETRGLGSEFLGQQDPEQLVKIPISCEGVRSLNLANAVSIALYEALRQQNQRSQ